MANKKADNIDLGTFNAVNSDAEGPVKSNEQPLTDKEEIAKLKLEKQKKILGENPEVFNHEGQKVYAKNKNTGEMMFFDADGEEVDFDIVDRLEVAYPTVPETGDLGGAKKGDLQVRYTKEVLEDNPSGKGKITVTKDVPEGECDLISERQDYDDETVWTKSVPKKHINIVKLLRGEIGKEEVKDKDKE